MTKWKVFYKSFIANNKKLKPGNYFLFIEPTEDLSLRVVFSYFIRLSFCGLAETWLEL